MPTAFKDLADVLSDDWVLKATADIGHLRQPSRPVCAGVGDDDLVGIGVHDEVRVVGHDDDLAPVSGLDESADKLVEDRLGSRFSSG